jgi:hypothetical protein
MRPEIELQNYLRRLHRDAQLLAGGLSDVAQRATTYHHLFEDSGGNHVFPLIAAHGALWSQRYFAFGMKLARALSWQYPFSAARRTTQIAAVARFADAFREINRRVCVECYVMYHFTARWGDHPEVGRFVAPPLLNSLAEVHAARRAGHELRVDAKRRIFAAQFLDEQQRIVGPAIDSAQAEFGWPLMRYLALRPTIRFAYFPPRQTLRFHRFDDIDERIDNGFRAFDAAAATGWRQTEAALGRYGVLPAGFFASSAAFFAAQRKSLLQEAA